MSEEKSKKKANVDSERVILREYSKVIFFYPLFLTSLILGIIQLLYPESGAMLGFVWMIIFFINLFVTAFNISSTKFFILILGIIVAALVIIFFVIPYFNLNLPNPTEFNIEMTSQFYFITGAILGILLLIAFLETRINYWKIERNEIYHKKGIIAEANRYPVRGLRIKKEIPDVFEYLILRAGSINLSTERENFHLRTVPNISNKEDKIDKLLSHLHVEADELDQ